jgi:hypothetical protein
MTGVSTRSGTVHTVAPTGGRTWRAIAKYRDEDGRTRRVERYGRSEAAAIRELKKALRDRSGPDVGEITGETRFKVIADLFLAETKRRRISTTYDTYALHMRNHVLPAYGELRAREITVVRIARFLRACELTMQAKRCGEPRHP